jgi:hypothetical protein
MNSLYIIAEALAHLLARRAFMYPIDKKRVGYTVARKVFVEAIHRADGSMMAHPRIVHSSKGFLRRIWRITLTVRDNSGRKKKVCLYI